MRLDCTLTISAPITSVASTITVSFSTASNLRRMPSGVLTALTLTCAVSSVFVIVFITGSGCMLPPSMTSSIFTPSDIAAAISLPSDHAFWKAFAVSSPNTASASELTGTNSILRTSTIAMNFFKIDLFICFPPTQYISFYWVQI